MKGLIWNTLIQQEGKNAREKTGCLFMSSACAVRVELHSQEPTGDLPSELNRDTLIALVPLSPTR